MRQLSCLGDPGDSCASVMILSRPLADHRTASLLGKSLVKAWAAVMHWHALIPKEPVSPSLPALRSLQRQPTPHTRIPGNASAFLRMSRRVYQFYGIIVGIIDVWDGPILQWSFFFGTRENFAYILSVLFPHPEQKFLFRPRRE